MKKYYQINTVSKLAKPITSSQAAKKIENREFIPWYVDDEIVFIADCTDDEIKVENIVRNKLNQFGKLFNSECFYIAPSF